MEANGSDGNSDDRAQTVVIQLETEEELSTRSEQPMKSDNLLKSLSPLIISMRALGLYFTREPHVNAEVGSDLTAPGPSRRRCQAWNAGRIYATVILVASWLNAARYCVIFDGNETVGAGLFLKLGIVTSVSLNVILRSTYYIASHTGSLDRVFRDADLCTANFAPKYSRMAKVVTIVSLIIVSSNIIYSINMTFVNKQYNDVLRLFFTKTYPLLKSANFMRALFIVLQVEALSAWALPQAIDIIQISSIVGTHKQLKYSNFAPRLLCCRPMLHCN